MLSVHAYFNGRGFSFYYKSIMYEFNCIDSAKSFLKDNGYIPTSYILNNECVVGQIFFYGDTLEKNYKKVLTPN